MFDIDKALSDIKFSTQHPDERLQELTRQRIDCEIRKKHGITPKHKLSWAFPAVAAMLVAFVFLFVLAPAADEVSYVTVDINPSVSMQLSASGTVLLAAGENDDAKALLKTIKLKGLRFEEALGTIIQAADTQGYLKDNGHVLVACFGDEPGITQGQIEKTVAESTHREVKVLLLQSNRKMFKEAKAQKLRPGVELLKKQASEQGIKEQDVDEIMGRMAEKAEEKKNDQNASNAAAQSEKNESRPTPSPNGQSQKDHNGADNERDTEKQNQKDKDDSKVNEGSGNAASSPDKPDKPDNGNNGNQNSDKQSNSAEEKKGNSKNEPNDSKADNAEKEEKQPTTMKGDNK